MLELDIPLQSPSSFSPGGGLYRCRTFPGLKDLMQEGHSSHLQGKEQQEEEDEEEGYWSSIQDTDTSQTHEGSMPSPGLLMSSSSSWGSWKGSSDLWLEGGEGGIGGERESLTSLSSPGILLSSEDLWRNSKEAEEKNKCWIEGFSKLTKTSTFNSLNSGTGWLRKDTNDISDSDSDCEEIEEDISLHCYILPSASRTSFYFVKRSLEAIPEEEEPEESANCLQMSKELSDIEDDDEVFLESEPELTPSKPEEELCKPEDEFSRPEMVNSEEDVDLNVQTITSSLTQGVNQMDVENSIAYKRGHKYKNLSLLEELTHQDINDMYCVLSYMPQNSSNGRPYEHTFKVGSPPVCESVASKGYISGNRSTMGTKRRPSNPLGSPIPSGPVSFRPRCAKIYPAETEDTTSLNTWVYQEHFKPKLPEYSSATCKESRDIKKSEKAKRVVSNQSGPNKHKKSSRNSKRKHKKQAHSDSFLHRIWKSFRRKMLIMEQE